MNCPKCRHELQVPSEICPHCGIVFAKYRKYHPEQADRPAVQAPIVTLYEEDTARPLMQLLFYEARQPTLAYFSGGLIIFIGLIIWSWQLISASIESNAVGNSLLHNVNLPFHEAGHIIFRPFGAFITSLGGTLGQLLMPSICAGVLLIKTRDPFGASVALWWVGENFLDIAPYMNDARAGQLPLLGGNFGHSAPYGFHDWQYLLTESGLLQYDHLLAKAVFALGTVIMLLSLLWGGLLLFKRYKAWRCSY
ncbi:zinc ribbon domain-containing protein [Candidatus Methylobacter oryzae]|uniref:Zinc ribbon domain-containing protein n=1 Tax=Candidatus Methylobacter oryzae TaxID=2497749 RepID=A0ABY3CI13_9GAMM|nr:zinc ribbon domain-containing protein [Candidatus Methylobacter oryzae]TRX00905.1 zinc ribbon domain-containing protein [Candidatus Methylobacter oryzae]